MKTKTIVPIIICIAAAFLLYMNLNVSVPEGYVDLDAVAAQSQLAQSSDVQIIDVRTPAEFLGGHIEGARNIDFYGKDFEGELKELDRNAQYFIYCRTGNRSSSALKLMHRLGFTKVWHLHRGIVDWKGSGLPLVK
nr:rhodanese-like domain-containing protein [uncultured Pseudodesulfovibrio sp.]